VVLAKYRSDSPQMSTARFWKPDYFHQFEALEGLLNSFGNFPFFFSKLAKNAFNIFNQKNAETQNFLKLKP